MAVKDKVSTRLDPEVLAVVSHVAETERRPIANLVRNIVSDWVAAREQATQQQQTPRAA